MLLRAQSVPALLYDAGSMRSTVQAALMSASAVDADRPSRRRSRPEVLDSAPSNEPGQLPTVPLAPPKERPSAVPRRHTSLEGTRSTSDITPSEPMSSPVLAVKSPTVGAGLHLPPDVSAALTELRDSLEDGFVVLAYGPCSTASSFNNSSAPTSNPIFSSDNLRSPCSSKMAWQEQFSLCVVASGNGGDVVSEARKSLLQRDEVHWAALRMHGDQMMLINVVPLGVR